MGKNWFKVAQLGRSRAKTQKTQTHGLGIWGAFSFVPKSLPLALVSPGPRELEKTPVGTVRWPLMDACLLPSCATSTGAW